MEGCLAEGEPAATIRPIKTVEIRESSLTPEITVLTSMQRVNFVDWVSSKVYNDLAPLILMHLLALTKLDVARIFLLLRRHDSLMRVDDGVFGRYRIEPAWIKGVLIFGNLEICKGLLHLVEAAKNSACFKQAFFFCIF